MAPTQGLRYTIPHIIVHLPGQGVMHLAAFVLLFKMFKVFNQSSKFKKRHWNLAKFDAKGLLVFKMTKIPINVSRFRNPTDLYPPGIQLHTAHLFSCVILLLIVTDGLRSYA